MKRQSIKRITIDDVASMAGVSKTTVSRYINGNHEILAEDTCRRIEEAVKTLDYRPNQMAQGLKRQRSNLIGMVVADITNPYSVAVLRGAEDVCKKNGYSLMVCNTDNDPSKEREYIFRLQQQRIDGLIINTTGHNNEFLQQFDRERTAVVLVDRKVPELEFDNVVVNNEEVTSETVRYLINQGYQRIALFSEPFEGVSSRYERLVGFRAELSRQGHPSFNDVYLADRFVTGKIEEQLNAFIEDSKGQSRVLFAVNGVVMLKLILALQAKGLNVPEDIAIAGFDNLDWTPAVGKGITTIAQPTYDIGVTAMELILLRIHGEDSPAKTIVLNGTLIVRGSTPLVK